MALPLNSAELFPNHTVVPCDLVPIKLSLDATVVQPLWNQELAYVLRLRNRMKPPTLSGSPSRAVAEVHSGIWLPLSRRGWVIGNIFNPSQDHRGGWVGQIQICKHLSGCCLRRGCQHSYRIARPPFYNIRVIPDWPHSFPQCVCAMSRRI